MKRIKWIVAGLAFSVLAACNASNADNPSNSAESPESDSATEHVADYSTGTPETYQVDTMRVSSDTMQNDSNRAR